MKTFRELVMNRIVNGILKDIDNDLRIKVEKELKDIEKELPSFESREELINWVERNHAMLPDFITCVMSSENICDQTTSTLAYVKEYGEKFITN